MSTATQRDSRSLSATHRLTDRLAGLPWLRILDVVIGLGLFAVGYMFDRASMGIVAGAEPRDAIGVALLAAMTLPLVWRQVAPLSVMAVITAAWVLDRGLGYADTVSTFGLVVAMHAVGAFMTRNRALITGAVTLAIGVAWTSIGIALDYDNVGFLQLVSVVLWVGLPFAIGRGDAAKRERLTRLELAANENQRSQQEAAEAAVRVERSRIARELHDVVAHEITVMTLQAEGARRMVGDSEPRVSEALQTISASGRKGLAEMQRMISVLRDTAESTPGHDPAVGTPHVAASSHDLAPVPSLSGLKALAKQVEEAGMPVDLSISGSHHVPAGVELSAYRIVQESLTNALKHAGPGAQATVCVTRSADSVEIVVEDDGRGVVSDAAKHSGGHGLTGMRERVVALGGTIEFGPRPGGGFRVRASLPSHDDTIAA